MREISGYPARAGRTRTGGVAVPGWFARELSLVDENYYVDWDAVNHYFKIVLDAYQLVDAGRQIVRIKYPLIRAVFDTFDMRPIHDLRKRKWINRHFGSNERYYRWLRQQDRDRKAKEKEVADDMITEGIIKMDRMERTKTFT